MENIAQSLYDVLKIFIGPVIGFIAAYYFNIFQIRRREITKRKMLQYILKEATFDLSESIDEDMSDLKEIINNLDAWILALHTGVINRADRNGEFFVVKKRYKLSNNLDNDILDGIFDIAIYDIHHINISSEMMKLSFLRPIDYQITSLILSLERFIEDYNESGNRTLDQIGKLRREIISYVDGINKIEDLEKDIKLKNSIIVSLQEMRNCTNRSFELTQSLNLVLEKINPLISASALDSQFQESIVKIKQGKTEKV